MSNLSLDYILREKKRGREGERIDRERERVRDREGGGETKWEGRKGKRDNKERERVKGSEEN